MNESASRKLLLAVAVAVLAIGGAACSKRSPADDAAAKERERLESNARNDKALEAHKRASEKKGANPFRDAPPSEQKDRMINQAVEREAARMAKDEEKK